MGVSFLSVVAVVAVVVLMHERVAHRGTRAW
jgi:hypothetical protein